MQLKTSTTGANNTTYKAKSIFQLWKHDNTTYKAKIIFQLWKHDNTTYKAKGMFQLWKHDHGPRLFYIICKSVRYSYTFKRCEILLYLEIIKATSRQKVIFRILCLDKYHFSHQLFSQKAPLYILEMVRNKPTSVTLLRNSNKQVWVDARRD